MTSDFIFKSIGKVVELTFENREMYQKLVDALSDPSIGGIIAADEEKLFDRDAIRGYIVEECRTA